MKINKDNLAFLKIGFEREVSKNYKSESTIKRYKSWIRRYIRFCLNFGFEINEESALSFIKSYETYTTRRQGYYAIKYLFSRILKISIFDLSDTYAEERSLGNNYYKRIKWLFYNGHNS